MKLVKRINSFISNTSIGFGALLLIVMPAMADNTLFFDDFNGPTLNPVWQASLPNANIAGAGGVASYLGAPNYSFQTLDGYSVLRMNTLMNNLQRVGWSTSTTYNPSAFTYEARFNTLTQSSSTSVDSFMELWILDPTNPNRYDMVSLFGGSYSTDLRFYVGSSIDNNYSSQAFNYQNNTWYHLVIQDMPGQNIRVSLDNDSGTELIGQTLNHTEGAFSSGFEIALSQGMDFPLATYPTDVAVDYVQLTAVPEPGSVVLTISGLLGLAVAGKRRSAQIKA